MTLIFSDFGHFYSLLISFDISGIYLFGIFAIKNIKYYQFFISKMRTIDINRKYILSSNIFLFLNKKSK